MREGRAWRYDSTFQGGETGLREPRRVRPAFFFNYSTSSSTVTDRSKLASDFVNFFTNATLARA